MCVRVVKSASTTPRNHVPRSPRTVAATSVLPCPGWSECTAPRPIAIRTSPRVDSPAVRSRSRVSCAAPIAGSVRLVDGRRSEAGRGDSPVRSEAVPAPGASPGAPEIDRDGLGPPLLDIAELPDGADGDRLDIPRQVIAAEYDARPPANGEPARPFAAGIVDVLNRQMAGGRHRGLVMEQEPGMVLDGQIEATETKLERPTIDGHQQPTAIQRAGLPAVACKPVLAVDPGQGSDQHPEVACQRQLRQADLVVDFQAPRVQAHLDRTIDPCIWDVVSLGGGGERGETEAKENRRESAHGSIVPGRTPRRKPVAVYPGCRKCVTRL